MVGFSPGKAIREELQARLPLYVDDWVSGLLEPKALSALLFTYAITLVPSLTFGYFLQRTTEGAMGIMEILVGTSLCGIAFSLFAGQPLVVVGVTGPVSIFSATLYGISKSLGLNFLGFMFWIAIWSALCMILLAVLNLCSLVERVTRFTEEIFALLISTIFIYEGASELVRMFRDTLPQEIGTSIFSLTLAVGTLGISLSLSQSYKGNLFWEFIRTFATDYAMIITVTVISLIPSIPALQVLRINRLDLPTSFQTTSGRPWVVSPTSVPVWAIFAAIIPALILSTLIFFDHNVSSLMVHDPRLKLKKPPAYNYDFLVVGLTLVLTAFLGLPFTHGLIPQAPLHAQSLAKRKQVLVQVGSGEKVWESVIDSVVETRVSNFGMSLLIGITALVPQLIGIISAIPVSVTSGIFLYMGFASMRGNALVSRCLMVFCDRRYRGLFFPHLDRVQVSSLFSYTALQVLILGLIFGITLTPGAIAFPMLIGLLVPFRIWVVPRWFKADELEWLDRKESPVALMVNDDDTIINDIPLVVQVATQ
jgi:hypothetical protein